MDKIAGTLLAAVLACGVLSIQAAIAQVLGNPLADPRTSFIGNSQSCSQPEKLTIPQAVAKRAKLKARLLNLLRESLFDDAKGIVNLAREKEIKDLAHTLTKDKAQ